MGNPAVKYDIMFQVVLLGDSNVGKTTLLTSFIEDQFKEAKVTVCQEAYTKILPIDGKKIMIMVVDTVGQEKHRGLTNWYYRKADGAILVYDITNYDSFVNLGFWLKEVNEKAEEGTVKILVGNKSDLNRNVYKNEALEYANKHDLSLIETSAKEVENVDKVFKTVISELYHKKLKDASNEVPKDNFVVLPTNNQKVKRKKKCCK